MDPAPSHGTSSRTLSGRTNGLLVGHPGQDRADGVKSTGGSACVIMTGCHRSGLHPFELRRETSGWRIAELALGMDGADAG